MIRQAALIGIAPRVTEIAENCCEGQEWRSQTAPTPSAKTPMMTAIAWRTGPCGPAGLSISTAGTIPSTALRAAITRQVLVCSPRTASSEVSQ